MRVGMSTFGCDGGRSGIGQYALSLLREFRKADPGHDRDILHFADEGHVFASGTKGETCLAFSNRLHNTWLGLGWYQTSLPRLCRRRGYDVFFFPDANRRLPYSLPCPTVGTVHDFSSLHMAGKYDLVRETYIRRVLPALVRRLTRILTVSECTKRDVVRHAYVPEDRVHVVHHGVDREVFRPLAKEAAAAHIEAKYGISPPFVLYIARIEHPGKNHVRLIEAFTRIKTMGSYPHTLLLAGSDWTRAEEIHRAARTSPVAKSIRFMGYVPEEDLPSLYSAADLFVFPSLYEGFGMPLLEAMACGTAVACSDCSSLPEVAGNAAELFPPHDPEAMAAVMSAILSDPDRRQGLIDRGLERVKGFSWRSTARRTCELIAETAQEGRTRSR